MSNGKHFRISRNVVVIAGIALIALAITFGTARYPKAAAQPQYPTKAVAVLHPTKGNSVSGVVNFTRTDEGVMIEAHVTGLTPGKHGFHIHEFGDISAPDGTSAGGHFNPAGHDHAGPDTDKRHVGDLGNLEADANGHAHYKRLDKVVELHGAHVIIGRAVIVHAGEDDLKTQPTGDAGGRVAVGVIGVAKAE